MSLAELFNRLFGAETIAPARLRQEIFSLGGRHRGEALAGARHELSEPQLSASRKALLRAVITHLTAAAALSETATPSRPGKTDRDG